MFNYKKLLGDTAIFAIGNLGSKFLNFLLVPFYTYYLTTSEYGTVDLILINVNLLFPVLTFSVYDAVLRFIMDRVNDNKSVVTNGFLVTFIGVILIIGIIHPTLLYYNVMEGYLELFLGILILFMFQSLLAQYIRAIGEIKKFAINGILTVFATGISNVLFLAIFHYGIYGFLYSSIIGLLVSNSYLFLFGKVYNFISIKKMNFSLVVSMLRYSIPLIPNTLSLWLTNASNRYFLLFFIGSSANGLYAVASKIPSLLNMLNSIFFQAWQLSAIDEYESENKSNIYTDVFNYFSLFVLLGTSAILVVLQPMLYLFFDNEYFTSWKIVPFLLLGTVFFSFASFLGTNYIAAKQTKGVFRTTFISSMLSLLLNFILIPNIGIMGAGVSHMVSNCMLFLIRLKDTKRFVEINFNFKSLILNIMILTVQILVLFFSLNQYLEVMLMSSLFILMLFYNRVILIFIFKSIKRLKTP